MIDKIKNYLKNIDALTYKIMKKGLFFSFFLAIISGLTLAVYGFTTYSPYIYYCGFALFKLSCILGVEFIICGLSMDTIKKQLI